MVTYITQKRNVACSLYLGSRIFIVVTMATGNRPTLQQNSNLKIDIKNYVSWCCSPIVYLISMSIFMVIQLSVFELRLLPFCMLPHFPVLRYQQKHFRNIKIGKKLKIDIQVENGCSFLKEYEFRYIFRSLW